MQVSSVMRLIISSRLMRFGVLSFWPNGTVSDVFYESSVSGSFSKNMDEEMFWSKPSNTSHALVVSTTKCRRLA